MSTLLYQPIAGTNSTLGRSSLGTPNPYPIVAMPRLGLPTIATIPKWGTGYS